MVAGPVARFRPCPGERAVPQRCRTARSTVAIRPGEAAKFVVTVERRNGFTGRVPLDVRGLPHGVMVQDLGLNGIMVTEKETKREIVVRAESWVKPMELPFAVVGRVERRGTEHAAAAVLTVR